MCKIKIVPILLFFFVSFLSIFSVKSQEIIINKSFFGNTYMQNEEKLSFSDLELVMEKNNEALAAIKYAKKNRIISYSLMGLGVATAVSTYVFNDYDERSNGLIINYIGAGIVLASIPFSKKAIRSAEKAIWIYNKDLDSTINQVKPELHVNVNGNGLGLTLTF